MNRLVIKRFLKMSTPIEWNVIVYDKPNTDRLPVRQEHLNNIAPAVNAGIVKSAGAIYKDIDKKVFAGSTFHLIAKSEEEIIEFLKNDPYYKAGIWNIDNVIANPVGIAVRLPKHLDGVTDSFYTV